MAYDFPSSPSIGQVSNGYIWDGEKWLASASVPNQAGIIRIVVFTSNGTYVPAPNATSFQIEAVGGGGGGGGTSGAASVVCVGGGGGGGGYAKSCLTAAQVGASQAITIGIGGVGNVNGTGNTGGTTSFGSLVSVTGGIGGSSVASGAYAGDGGGASGTGDFIGRGEPGEGGNWQTTINLLTGGGGGSIYGGGGRSILVPGGQPAAAGNPGYGYGGGGAGGGVSNHVSTAAGGNGSSGVVIVTEFGMTALSSSTNAAGAVRFDLPQSLLSTQQTQARANIAAMQATTFDTAWTPLPYLNGWVDYGAGYSPCGYRKLSSGLVILKGLVKNGTASVILTLPAGYRPGLTLIFNMQTNPGGATPCRVDVGPNGDIGHQGGSNVWISLSGIVFLAEN